jgi:hypothetical protein
MECSIHYPLKGTHYPFKPSFTDWENAHVICRLMKVFYEAVNVVSDTKYLTSNLCFHEILKVKLTFHHQLYEENNEFGDMVMYMNKKAKEALQAPMVNCFALL